MDFTETKKSLAFMSCFLVVQAMKVVKNNNMVKLRRVFIAIAGNGLGIAEGGAFQHYCSFEKLKLNIAQKFHRCSSPPLLAIPC